MSTALMPVVTRTIAERRGHHVHGTLGPVGDLPKIINAAYRHSGKTWTQLSMVCDVSVCTLRSIAYHRQTQVQSGTATRLCRLVELLP